ncbi:porin family protein [Zobellia sp. 1_MG-2023]|uniref:porin family protein n=1 Tax=Zobellia sp. 1_MG-2023 TaxID=3062626 RepID=UPI0026E48ADA|nr:porin family protein [Zobellia sp. 1_MG-2023]MDO6820474.1 porin family protein [Zobellia sp. 1_MG-2023]
MKIKFCVILTFVFFGIQSSIAQTVIQGTGPSGGFNMGDIKFGGKAGINFTTWLGNDFDGVSAKVGTYFGGIAEIPVMDDFYVQPELLFALQGADLGPSNVNLAYLQIPVMGKYHITEEVAVELGPQVGFLLADNWEEDLQFQDTKSIELGVNIGAGYRMDENFYFQFRIGVGLSEVLSVTKAHNGAVSVGAVYFL